jgi:hypothetical protein
MKNGIMVSAVVVFLVGSSAIAQIDLQYQNWDFKLTNSMDLSGGHGSATTIGGIGTLSLQSVGINPDENGDPTITAAQGVGVALFQQGSAGTNGAPVTLNQDLRIVGVTWGVNGPGQAQSVGDLSGSVAQYQGSALTGGNDLTKGEGSIGNANGLNIGALGMGQSATNTCADGLQLSLILGGQYSELNGTAQASGEVHADMTGKVQQYQTVNNPDE